VDSKVLKARHISMVSVIVDKMDIQLTFKKDMTQEEFGYTLILEIVRKIHYAEEPLYNLIGDMIGVDQDKVADMDLIELIGVIKEIYNAIVNFISPPKDSANSK